MSDSPTWEGPDYATDNVGQKKLISGLESIRMIKHSPQGIITVIKVIPLALVDHKVIPYPKIIICIWLLNIMQTFMSQTLD